MPARSTHPKPRTKAKNGSATDDIIIPDKLFFRIGEVAKLCKLPAYVLRFWETEFPQLDRKSTRLNSSHIQKSRMPSSA